MELLTFEDIISLCEKQYNSHILDSFSKKKSYYLRLLYESEGNGINYITSLRSKNFISDYDIYRLAYSKINNFSSDYSENNLLDIISTQKMMGHYIYPTVTRYTIYATMHIRNLLIRY